MFTFIDYREYFSPSGELLLDPALDGIDDRELSRAWSSERIVREAESDTGEWLTTLQDIREL
jgi:hypothetical protein